MKQHRVLANVAEVIRNQKLNRQELYGMPASVAEVIEKKNQLAEAAENFR